MFSAPKSDWSLTRRPPYELWEIIFRHLTIKDLLALRATNPELYGLVSTHLDRLFSGLNKDSHIDFYKYNCYRDENFRRDHYDLLLVVNGLRFSRSSSGNLWLLDITSSPENFVVGDKRRALFYPYRKNRPTSVLSNKERISYSPPNANHSSIHTPKHLGEYADRPIVKIISNDDCHFLITPEKTVIAWGNNLYNQLGLGPSFDDTDYIKEPTAVTTLASFAIDDVAIGYHSTFFITDKGLVLSCGDQGNGQLGRDASDDTMPTVIDCLAHLVTVKVIICSSHTFFVTTRGVFVCGKNWSGLLGLPIAVTVVHKPQLIVALSGLIVKQIVSNISSTFVIVSNGVVAFGDNTAGQLGLGHNDAVGGPQFITALLDHAITHIITLGTIEQNDRVSTIFVTDTGLVFGCGNNEYKQLGPELPKEVYTPMPIRFFEGKLIKKAIQLGNVTYFITDQNLIYILSGDFYGYGIGLVANINTLYRPGSLSDKFFTHQLEQFMRNLPIEWQNHDGSVSFQSNKNPAYINTAFLYAAIAKLGKKDFSNNNIATPEECVQFSALFDKIQKTPDFLQKTQRFLTAATNGYLIARVIYYQSSENVGCLLALLPKEQLINQTRALWQRSDSKTRSCFATMLDAHLSANNHPALKAILETITSS